MRPEELAEVVSRVKKAIETPPEKVRKSETVPQTKKSVKKTTDAAQWKEKKKEKTKQDQKEQTVKRAGKTKTVPQPVKVKNSKDEKRLTTEAAEAVEDKGEFLRFVNLAKNKENTKQDQKEQTVKRAGKTKTVPQPVKVKNSKDEKRLTTEAAEAVEDKGEFLRFLNLAKNKEKTKQDQKEQTGKRARKPKTVPQPVKFKNSKDERRLTTGTADAVEGQGEFLRFVNLAKNKEKTKQDQKEQTVKRARKTATVPQAGKVKETKDERRKTTDAADAVEDKGEFLRFLNLTNTQQLAASTNRRSKRRTRYKNDDRF
ncbi:uncharacterized protein DMAD_10219 [Drosophila madeirensis]